MNIFSHLSPKAFLLFSRTCRLARSAVAAYVAQAFDVKTTLRRFFPDPVVFRCIQARTGTLVSGSVALQFFDRAFYPSSDLDIYVYSQHRREVGAWLLGLGYTFFPGRGQDPRFGDTVSSAEQSKGLHYAMPGVSAIYTFRRQVDGEDLKVQIIVARRAPMEVILGFHSSKYTSYFHMTEASPFAGSMRHECDIVREGLLPVPPRNLGGATFASELVISGSVEEAD